MNASKLHAWRDAELAAVAGLVGDTWGQWRRAWGLPAGADASVACVPAPQWDCASWEPLDAAGAWISWSPVARGDLRSLLGPASVDSGLLEEAASACRQDACTRLAAVLRAGAAARTLPESSPPSGKWSGAAGAAFPCGSVLLMDAACIDRVLRTTEAARRPRPPARPPLARLPEAANRCTTRIEARLSGCELDVALLQRLRIGDVIRVPHALDRPISIHDAGGRAMFDGYLARSGGFKAVELAAAST